MTDTESWFIADKPASSANDIFDHADVASNLTSIVETVTPPLTVGLIGEFGVGKSTAIELLKKSHAGSSILTVIRISAQRHSSVNAERSLMYSIIDELLRADLISKNQFTATLSSLESTGARATTEALEVPIKKIISNNWQAIRSAGWWAALLAGTWLTFVVILGLVLAYASSDLTPLGDLLISGIGAPIAVLAGTVGAAVGWLSNARLISTVAANFFKPDVVTTTRPRIEAPDEIERHFAETVRIVDRRLVVAVDDIDRLPPDRMIAALNVVHDFQAACSQHPLPPVFVVSCDDRVVRDALVANSAAATTQSIALADLATTRADAERAAQAYLDRYFNQRLRMPPHSPVDLRGFARAVLQRDNHVARSVLGDELDAVVEILIHDGISDPRHAIKILNAFFADLRLAQLRERSTSRRGIRQGEVTRKPRVLARLTVLRVDFERAYEELGTTPELLPALVAHVQSEPDDAQKQAVDAFLTRLDSSNSDEDSRHSTSNSSSRLLRYISRTASWVEDVASLRPFVELGQDDIDRQLGSDTSTRYRRQVVNAELRTVSSALEEMLLRDLDGERDIESLLALFVTLLRDASGVELDNTVKSVDYIVPQLSEKARTRLAEDVGRALYRTDPSLRLSANSVALVPHTVTDRARERLFRVLITVDSEDRTGTNRRALAVHENWEPLTSALASDIEIAKFVEQALDLIGIQGSAEDLRPWIGRLRQAPLVADHETARDVLRAALKLVENCETDEALPSHNDVTDLILVSKQAALPESSITAMLHGLIENFDLHGAVGRLLAGVALESGHSESTYGMRASLVASCLSGDGDDWPGNLSAEVVRDVSHVAIELAATSQNSADLQQFDALAARLVEMSSMRSRITGEYTDLTSEEAEDLGLELLVSALTNRPEELRRSTSAAVESWRANRSSYADASVWIKSFSEYIDELDEESAEELLSSVRETVDGQPRTVASPQALEILKGMSGTDRGGSVVAACLDAAASNVDPTMSLPVIEGAVDALISLSTQQSHTAPSHARVAIGNIAGIDQGHRDEAVRGLLEISWAPDDRAQLPDALTAVANDVGNDTLLALLKLTQTALDDGAAVGGFSANVSAAAVEAIVTEPNLNPTLVSFVWERVGRQHRDILASHLTSAAPYLERELEVLDGEELTGRVRALFSTMLEQTGFSPPRGASAVADILRNYPTGADVIRELVSGTEDGTLEEPPIIFWTFAADALAEEDCRSITTRAAQGVFSGHDRLLLAVGILQGFVASSRADVVSESLTQSGIERKLADILTPLDELDHAEQQAEVDGLATTLGTTGELRKVALAQLGRKPNRNDGRDRDLWELAKAKLTGSGCQVD